MTRRVYLYFVLTFVAGAVVGAAGLFLYIWYFGHLARHSGPPDPQRIVRRLTQELDLNPDQVQRLAAILNDSFQKHRALDQSLEPQYQALRSETRAKIRQILSPAQQQKFDELVRRFEQRRQQGAPRGP